MNIVRFSPDGELFCTGSADCKAFLFNGKTAEEVGPLGGDKAHAGGIYGVSSFVFLIFVARANSENYLTVVLVYHCV